MQISVSGDFDCAFPMQILQSDIAIGRGEPRFVGINGVSTDSPRISGNFELGTLKFVSMDILWTCKREKLVVYILKLAACSQLSTPLPVWRMILPCDTEEQLIFPD